MKRIVTLLLAISMIASMFVTGYASFITSSPAVGAKSEALFIEWKGLSEVGTLEPGNVTFRLTAIVKNYKPVNYTLSATVDGEESSRWTMTAEPGRETVKDFTFSNILNGIHDVVITVSEGDRTALTFEDEIIVIKGYEKQFMDEMTDFGVCWPGAFSNPKYMKLFNFAGFSGVRKDIYWNRNEPSKGVYDWSYYEPWMNEMFDNGIMVNAILAYGNASVYPMWQSQVGKELPKNPDVRMGPHTQEGIRAYAKYGIEMLKKYPEISNLEIWNEPNIHFWKSDETTTSKKIEDMNYEYPDLLKATTSTIRGQFKNKMLGGLAFAGQGKDELRMYMDTGIYPYMSDLTYHFYMTLSNIDGGRSYEKKMIETEGYVLEKGGWKPLWLTECGYHTGTAISARTEEDILENMVKLYTVADAQGHELFVYSFNDAGETPSNAEDNWGMIRYDGSVKPHYVSVVEHNRQLSGGIYVGELNLGDSEIRAFVYLKENKPVVIIWDGSRDREEYDFTFEGESFSVNDVNGTLIAKETDTITLTKLASYINGLSHKYIALAGKGDLEYDRQLFADTYATMLPADVLGKADQAYANAISALENANEDNLKASVDEFTSVGITIIDKVEKGEITDLVASRATYEFFKSVETLCTVYMSEYKGSALTMPSYSTKAVQEKADRLYRDDNRIMQYSDSILQYAVNTEAKAQKLCGLGYNPEDVKGYIAGWGLLTKAYCELYDRFSDVEKVMDYALLAQVLPESRKGYVYENVNIKINANNYSKVPFKGTLRLYDEENNEIASSDTFELKPDGFKYIELPFLVTRYNEGSYRELRLSYIDENGKRVADERLVFNVKDSMKMFVQPCTTTIDKMESVDLKFTNLTDEEMVFNLKVWSDENYAFVNNVHQITIGAGEEKIVKLPISYIKETMFHYYTVRYEAVSDTGIVMAKGEVPLNFTAIVKADKEIKPGEFTGDISDWYDAYPIYMNSPENPNNKESWENVEIAARAFLKWDESHLYLMIDAYDDAQYNYHTDASIWDGDSMQISLDTKNTKSTKYDDDDYELGMAIGGVGVEFWAWQSPIKNTTGKVDFINIIRDDDKMVTRYIAAFPKSEIPTLELKGGNVFGMNIAINEGDVLNRDGYYQFTSGTADSKNPSLYADFIFTNGNKENYIDGKAMYLFPLAINKNR